MLVKFWTKSYGPNYTKFDLFDNFDKKKKKKKKKELTIFDKVLTPFWKTFL